MYHHDSLDCLISIFVNETNLDSQSLSCRDLGGISRDHGQESQHWWISWRLYFQHAPNKMSNPMACFFMKCILATSEIVAMTWLQFDPYLICQMKSQKQKTLFQLQVHWQIMWFGLALRDEVPLQDVHFDAFLPFFKPQMTMLILQSKLHKKFNSERAMRRKYQEMVSHLSYWQKKIPWAVVMQSAAWCKILWPVQDFVQDLVVHCNPPRTGQQKHGSCNIQNVRFLPWKLTVKTFRHGKIRFSKRKPDKCSEPTFFSGGELLVVGSIRTSVQEEKKWIALIGKTM